MHPLIQEDGSPLKMGSPSGRGDGWMGQLSETPWSVLRHSDSEFTGHSERTVRPGLHSGREALNPPVRSHDMMPMR